MILTDIRPRRRRLSQLYIDGEAAVQVDTETLARSGLAVGDELDDEALHALLQASAEHRAHEKALYLLEHRAHSKKELADKIARAEFDREAAQPARFWSGNIRAHGRTKRSAAAPSPRCSGTATASKRSSAY